MGGSSACAATARACSVCKAARRAATVHGLTVVGARSPPGVSNNLLLVLLLDFPAFTELTGDARKQEVKFKGDIEITRMNQPPHPFYIRNSSDMHAPTTHDRVGFYTCLLLYR